MRQSLECPQEITDALGVFQFDYSIKGRSASIMTLPQRVVPAPTNHHAADEVSLTKTKGSQIPLLETGGTFAHMRSQV